MPKGHDSSAQTRRYDGGTDEAAVQLEEYRQVYALALYRLNCLDSRTPLTATFLTGTLGAVVLLPAALQFGVLVLLPVTLLWLVRSTIGHARSFEDCLRHIEGLEHALNRRFHEPLIDFQSSHPSGGTVVGGRTGEENVLMVLGTSLMLLAGCGLAYATLRAPTGPQFAAYLAHLTLVAATMLSGFRGLHRYRYRKRGVDRVTLDPGQR
jgi:hypothetical protein